MNATDPFRPGVVLYQEPVPKREPPSCLNLLKWLDCCTDTFNGQFDRGPKHSLLHDRHAIPRREVKYQSEDLEDAILLFFQLCRSLEISPSKATAYRAVLEADISHHLASVINNVELAYWRGRQSAIVRALNENPKYPMAAMRAISDQLWLRAALQVDKTLPAPWPSWPVALKRELDQAKANFRGGSETWTRSEHQAGTWAKRTLLERLGGWNIEPDYISPEFNVEIEKARASLWKVRISLG